MKSWALISATGHEDDGWRQGIRRQQYLSLTIPITAITNMNTLELTVVPCRPRA